jgi:hypothetical protein
MQIKRFCSLTSQNETKFGQDIKVEFKKSFKLYRKILVRAIMKIAKKNFRLALHLKKFSCKFSQI